MFGFRLLIYFILTEIRHCFYNVGFQSLSVHVFGQGTLFLNRLKLSICILCSIQFRFEKRLRSKRTEINDAEVIENLTLNKSINFVNTNAASHAVVLRTSCCVPNWSVKKKD